MWSQLQAARMSAHRRNIERYKKILGSYLTPQERQFVERRIREEEGAIVELFGQTLTSAVLSAESRNAIRASAATGATDAAE